MRGNLWRVASEQIRPASNDENLGIEVVNRFLGDLKVDLERRGGQRRFVDVEREGAPRFPWEDRPAGGQEAAEDDEAERAEALEDDSDDEDEQPPPAPGEGPPERLPKRARLVSEPEAEAGAPGTPEESIADSSAAAAEAVAPSLPTALLPSPVAAEAARSEQVRGGV